MTQTTETRYVIERNGMYASELDWTHDLSEAKFRAKEPTDLTKHLMPTEIGGSRVRKVTVTTTYVIEGE